MKRIRKSVDKRVACKEGGFPSDLWTPIFKVQPHIQRHSNVPWLVLQIRVSVSRVWLDPFWEASRKLLHGSTSALRTLCRIVYNLQSATYIYSLLSPHIYICIIYIYMYNIYIYMYNIYIHVYIYINNIYIIYISISLPLYQSISYL